MDRREFMAAGIAGALAPGLLGAEEDHVEMDSSNLRKAFPRTREEVFLNAAGGTPLGTFVEAGLQRYLEFQRLGPGSGRGEAIEEMLGNVPLLFAELIGARPEEIGLVHCTKAGEQLVLDGLVPLESQRNIVTNDLHFSGSLHNLLGRRQAGADVRIVRARNFVVDLADMTEAIDENTALVVVTLVSNINGHIEKMRELCEAAHQRGALVYADIIQAAGIVPLNVRDLGIDFAACSGYKWLYGVHGTGFLYVRHELQGAALPDSLFPGLVRYNYAPWVSEPDPDQPSYRYRPPADARRYQPGHPSYLGYCGLHEGLRLVQKIGVENALAHSCTLNRWLLQQIDPQRYPCLTPEVEKSPILTLATTESDALRQRLQKAKIVVALGRRRLRISPGLYSNTDDMQQLADALNA
jgi:selenocysteine lyase/cysteine desulfurase